jgi:hypothetical protein
MQDSDTLTLQAFLNALTHLDQPLDADTEAEISQKIRSLTQTAHKFQPLQEKYAEALINLENHLLLSKIMRSSISEISPEAGDVYQNSHERKPGLHPGAFIVSDDFDEPLPDSFWLGEA